MENKLSFFLKYVTLIWNFQIYLCILINMKINDEIYDDVVEIISLLNMIATSNVLLFNVWIELVKWIHILNYLIIIKKACNYLHIVIFVNIDFLNSFIYKR